jgi:hypothetical protein
MHIHTGTNCSDHAFVGGHYYASTLSNPWPLTTARYVLRKIGGNSTNTYASKGSFTIYNGYNLTATEGHAFVIHKADGGRIACGKLMR